jgi:hypothetical protein
MSVRILDVREVTKPIASSIANAYIDFIDPAWAILNQAA